jgi:hypothetical protein
MIYSARLVYQWKASDLAVFATAAISTVLRFSVVGWDSCCHLQGIYELWVFSIGQIQPFLV